MHATENECESTEEYKKDENKNAPTMGMCERVNERLCIFLCSTCGYFQHFIFELNWIFFYINCRLCSTQRFRIMRCWAFYLLFCTQCAGSVCFVFCFSLIQHTLSHHMQRSKLHPHIYLGSLFILLRRARPFAKLTYCGTRSTRYFYLSSDQKIPLCVAWRFIN